MLFIPLISPDQFECKTIHMNRVTINGNQVVSKRIQIITYRVKLVTLGG